MKMTGIGNSHIAIKASPRRRHGLTRGSSLLHDFWDYESAKAFEQAIRVDPNCAMCWWGLAQALEHARRRSVKRLCKKALAKAVRVEGPRQRDRQAVH